MSLNRTSPIVTSLLALTISCNGKEYPVYEQQVAGTGGEYVQLIVNKKLNEVVSGRRLSSIYSARLFVAMGKAAEMWLAAGGSEDAFRWFFTSGKDAKGANVYAPSLHIMVEQPLRQGQIDTETKNRLAALELQMATDRQLAQLRFQMAQLKEDFELEVLNKDEYIAARKLLNEQIAGLMTAQIAATVKAPVNQEQTSSPEAETANPFET